MAYEEKWSCLESAFKSPWHLKRGMKCGICRSFTHMLYASLYLLVLNLQVGLFCRSDGDKRCPKRVPLSSVIFKILYFYSTIPNTRHIIIPWPAHRLEKHLIKNCSSIGICRPTTTKILLQTPLQLQSSALRTAHGVYKLIQKGEATKFFLPVSA